MNLADANIVSLPAELMKNVLGPNVLIVGSNAFASTSSRFSDYGSPVVEIWAPGESWQAIAPTGALKSFEGTSASAPVAAGLAALVLSRFPQLVGLPVALHDHLVGTAVGTIDVKPQGCAPKETEQPRLDALQSLLP